MVKLHLDIDENQNEDEAFWFPFLPPSVDIMYSMPLIGESVRLYFPNESSEKPTIVGCARKNGDTCEKTSESSKRYYETEHGSEIAMIPDALTITGGCKETLSVSFEDNVGVTFTSPKKLSLNAGGEIEINTPRYIKINATSQLKMIKGNTTNGVLIEGEFHITANNVIKNGSDTTSYDKYTEDESQDAKSSASAKENAKKSFSVGNLVNGLMGAVAKVSNAVEGAMS